MLQAAIKEVALHRSVGIARILCMSDDTRIFLLIENRQSGPNVGVIQEISNGKRARERKENGTEKKQ